jgi:NAD(P)-dependent dehydrogenase (short-subunit alcohol dehydrogenase family)
VAKPSHAYFGNAVTVSFAKELAPFGIKVNVVEPGHLRTDLNKNTGFVCLTKGL